MLEVGIGEPWGAAVADAEPGRRAVFDHGEVRIETIDGEVLESRLDPRRCSSGARALRRNLRWDDLDATYFAGYAWWNYLNAPYLLTREDVSVREVEPWRDGARPGAGSRPTSPRTIDTHCRRQVFYYDRELRLRRHDYTAEVVGALGARGAHVRRPRRGRRAACSRPGAGCCRGGPATDRCRSLRWWPCACPRSRFE